MFNHPQEHERKAKILVSPKFKLLGAASGLADLEERLPVLITTGLAQAANHIVVVARQEANEILSQTVSRFSNRDFVEAHDGGTIQITQHYNISDEEAADLNQLLKDKVNTRLRALGVDLIV